MMRIDGRLKRWIVRKLRAVPRRRVTRVMVVEPLEQRCLLDAALPDVISRVTDAGMEIQMVPKVVVADSPNLHLARDDQFTGVVQLVIEFDDGSIATCTGTLLDDRKHILTAAHCLTDTLSGELIAVSVQARFDIPNGTITVTQNDTRRFAVHPEWLGVDGGVPNSGIGLEYGADIAVIALPQKITDQLVDAYPIYRNTDEVGREGIFVGYGMTGSGGDTQRYSDGRKRYGRNIYDAVAEDLNNVPDLQFNIRPDTQLLYDFDNGTATNDAAFRTLGIEQRGVDPLTDEVITAPGDSGGPVFFDIDGTLYIAGVTSWGVSLGTDFGDIDGNTNFTFGELAFDTRVSTYADWIDQMRGLPPGGGGDGDGGGGGGDGGDGGGGDGGGGQPPQPPQPPNPTPPFTTYLISTDEPGVATMSDGTVLAYDDSDILALVVDSKGMLVSAEIYFDGSDVGLDTDAEDIDAFAVDSNGNIYVSLAGKGLVDTPNGMLVVGVNDIIKFTPTKLGRTTTGTWEWYFDGSDVGLFGPQENIDALTFADNGDLIISTYGSGIASGGFSFQNGDLLRFAPSSTGPNTAGTWSQLASGPALGFNGAVNNLDALWTHPDGNRVGFSSEEDYSFGGLVAQNEDLLLHFLDTGTNAALLNTSPMGLRPYNVDGMFILPGDIVSGSSLPLMLVSQQKSLALAWNSSQGTPVTMASSTALDAVSVGSVMAELGTDQVLQGVDVQTLPRDTIRVASEEEATPSWAAPSQSLPASSSLAAGLFDRAHKRAVDEVFQELDEHSLEEEVHTSLAEELAKALSG